MRATTVLLDHGAGGRASRELTEEIFAKHLANPFLAPMDDAAVLPASPLDLAVSTDTFVVTPLFFPGGDIGSLAVHGTVNDVAMQAAQPRYLTCGFVLEEGLALELLERAVASLAAAAKAVGVSVVAGDTKVVGRGQADGLFINTTGIGVIPPGRRVGASLAQAGDAILVSGTMGDHGMTIMAARAGLGLTSPLVSDSAPLTGLVEALYAAGVTPHVLRDPTRGGLATALKEIALASEAGLELTEAAIPLSPAVIGAAELLGLEPLYLANEGKLIAIVPGDQAETARQTLQNHPLGQKAQIIGQVQSARPGRVWLNTAVGGQRPLEMLTGEPLPRIC
ncbi:MAG: hydrogenase expression/formation protein HypE [Deltaproteobacteria bacterium]|nr:hydrogenase expression/formation protein HypE [Deltaproteobacteria bacterium]